MLPIDPYNPLVRANFFTAAHAGVLNRDYPLCLSAAAGEPEHGGIVALAAGISDEVVVEMKFRAWGCPHLIAAAELLCQERESDAVAGLSVFDVEGYMALLDVPVPKTGRILLLEDALKSLWAQFTGAIN